MLVNYTGAAGDLPGEIPRKIGPRGLKIRPLDLWPWSEKLHFVIPGRLRTLILDALKQSIPLGCLAIRLFFSALNPHFMLVNYTGAAGDLPGEIPRKSDHGVVRYAPWIFWPWSEKLHFVMPGRLWTFGSEPGRTCATHFEKQRSLLLVVLGGSVRGTRLPSLTSFLSPSNQFILFACRFEQ
jgi:hypothetical protein